MPDPADDPRREAHALPVAGCRPAALQASLLDTGSLPSTRASSRARRHERTRMTQPVVPARLPDAEALATLEEPCHTAGLSPKAQKRECAGGQRSTMLVLENMRPSTASRGPAIKFAQVNHVAALARLSTS